MDADRFDSLARVLSTAGSRRRALTATLAGALGVLSLADHHEATAGGACKPSCGSCFRCKKGKCKKTKHGKKCKKGTCQPLPNGTVCTSSGGGTCQNGTCVCPDGTEECGGACLLVCPSGSSTRNPDTCDCCRFTNLVTFSSPCNVPFPCCSGICQTDDGPPPGSICIGLGSNTACQFGGMCASGVCDNGFCTAPS